MTQSIVFADRSMSGKILSFLPPAEQDKCKSASRSLNYAVDSRQRRTILSKLPDAFVRGVGKARLERAHILNVRDPIHFTRLTYKNLPATESFIIGLQGDLPFLAFKVDCHAEGVYGGSMVVKKTLGKISFDDARTAALKVHDDSALKERVLSFLTHEEQYQCERLHTLSKRTGMPGRLPTQRMIVSYGLPDGDPVDPLSQLSTLPDTFFYHFLQGGSLDYTYHDRIILLKDVIGIFYPIVYSSFAEDLPKSCFSRLVRHLCFSPRKSSLYSSIFTLSLGALVINMKSKRKLVLGTPTADGR